MIERISHETGVEDHFGKKKKPNGKKKPNNIKGVKKDELAK